MSAIAGPLDGASEFVYFKVINDFLSKEIDIIQWKLLTSSAAIIGYVAIVVLTVWIMFQGFRIVTGQSRQPMMALVGDALKATLIVFIATTAALSSSSVYWTLTDGMSTAISGYVTDGQSDPFQSIDNNLAQMQVSLSLIDAIDTGGNTAAQDAKDRDRWFTGIGIAGPGVIAGAMLLLNKIALALFVGFGPIFILCLLFEQTRSLFSKWLLYGIGTVFSLAVLSIMVTIAMKMMAAVTAAFLVKYYASMAGMGSSDGINSMALQQGGLGLLLSTLIISAPPIAATFFQGTLAQFSGYSPFGQIGQPGRGGRSAGNVPPGTAGYSHSPSYTLAEGGQGNTLNSQNFNNRSASAGSANYAPQADNVKVIDRT